MMSVRIHHANESSRVSSGVVEVFDPEFKYVVEVPAALVRHLPPARLNITRLVFCRNYAPSAGAASCAMGDACKFVHADVDPTTLEAHPIHVKYAWRHEDLCTYARLPAGETLAVASPNNRTPLEHVPSERVLVTRGSLARHEHAGPLSHCAHYYFNRMCNRGERCNFIHAVHVDPAVVGDFKRAPARPMKRGGSGSFHSAAAPFAQSPSDTFDEVDFGDAAAAAPAVNVGAPAFFSYAMPPPPAYAAIVGANVASVAAAAVSDSPDDNDSCGCFCSECGEAAAAAAAAEKVAPVVLNASNGGTFSDDVSENDDDVNEASAAATSSEVLVSTRRYRHNPYSLAQVTIWA